MCLAMPQLMMLSTMATATSSIMAGNAQARAYEASAKGNIKQLQKEKDISELEAEQAELERLQTLSEATSANTTAMAFMGRDITDPSAMALMKKNYDATQEDIKRIKLQKKLVSDKIDMQIQQTAEGAGARATASKASGYFQAINTGAEGIIRIKDVE
tara:strand:+ start:333 stop:806 length:474 start_codon:yes stop_codon:yes gene_type:complete